MKFPLLKRIDKEVQTESISFGAVQGGKSLQALR